MDIKESILRFAQAKRAILSRDVAGHFGVSRQYASKILNNLVKQGLLMKRGSTRASLYVSPAHVDSLRGTVHVKLKNKSLKEHEILEAIDRNQSFGLVLRENVRSIFAYAFCEMLNNAIEHSRSSTIEIDVDKNQDLIFRVNDVGVGVFFNVMKKRRLQSELEAIQDLLKGKMTTQPRFHSGEGIFFTSKIADVFSLESHKHKLTIDNRIHDVFVEEVKHRKKGTKVRFQIGLKSKKHLSAVFKEYQTDPSEYAFDKTKVQIRLYTLGILHVSRSQARRVLAGLEKFKLVILDFDKVPAIGQAFADEIFRVFQNAHPSIEIRPTNMNEPVRFMVGRVGK